MTPTTAAGRALLANTAWTEDVLREDEPYLHAIFAIEAEAAAAVRAEVADRLRAWAECVDRLIADAPIAAVKRETGVRGGHTTPPEREAIREAAKVTVARWLARDLAIIEAVR